MPLVVSLKALGGDYMKYLEKQSPARIIAIGFLAVILTGSFLLMLPVVFFNAETGKAQSES